MIILDSTSKKLELVTTVAGSIDFLTAYIDHTSTEATPKASDGNISTATTTDIVSAPAASTQRQVMYISIRNKNSSQEITFRFDISGTKRELIKITLATNELLEFTEGIGWKIYDKNGRVKTIDPTKSETGIIQFYNKTGTSADATGYWYCHSKDAGFPGAWSVGTPGASGRATNGLSSSDAGCLSFPDAGSGRTRYLTRIDITSTVLESFFFADILWVNSGLSATTTTEQTVNSVALPARDDDGTVNGKGCMIGLLATTALGNAAVISNSTISYTNEAGTSGRTATLAAVVGSQIPATPVIGTVVWFQLQSGDRGVKSIQTITLNTSLTSGSFSLIIARPIAMCPVTVVNNIIQSSINNNNGIKLYDRACLHLFYQAANTTSPVVTSTLYTEER